MFICRRPVCLGKKSKVRFPSCFAETSSILSVLLPSWSSLFSSACAEIAQVLKPYSSSSPELLNLESGQLILILSKSTSGWWLGELQVCVFSLLHPFAIFASKLYQHWPKTTTCVYFRPAERSVRRAGSPLLMSKYWGQTVASPHRRQHQVEML